MAFSDLFKGMGNPEKTLYFFERMSLMKIDYNFCIVIKH